MVKKNIYQVKFKEDVPKNTWKQDKKGVYYQPTSKSYDHQVYVKADTKKEAENIFNYKIINGKKYHFLYKTSSMSHINFKKIGAFDKEKNNWSYYD